MTPPETSYLDNEGNEPDNLEDKIKALEVQLKSLQNKNNINAGFLQYSEKEKWKVIPFVFLLIFLSGLPPLFIVVDRWLQVSQLSDYQRDNWCKVDFLCKSSFPSYFMGIFFLLGLTFILMLVFAPSFYGKIAPIFKMSDDFEPPKSSYPEFFNFRKLMFLFACIGFLLDLVFCIIFKRIPGMELLLVVAAVLGSIYTSEKEIDPQVFRNWIAGVKRKILLYLTIIFSQIALILFLHDSTLFKQHHWIYTLLLLIAITAVISQRKQIGKIYWLFTLGLILYTFQMNSWKFSMIGDEYIYFFYPNEVIAHQSFLQIVDSFFNIKAVYEIVPYFSSFITYLFMMFLGFDHFSWHLSITMLMVLTIPIFYDFLRSFIPERVAFFAVIPLAFSHYLVNFSKIGYTNLQALFMMCLILWVASKAIKQKTFSIYFILGICCGACFYTYPLSLYTLPLVSLFILLFDPPRSKFTWLRYSFAILGLVILMIPIFFQPLFWSNMAGRTVFFINNSRIITSTSSADLVNRFTYNLLYIPFVYLFIPGEANYIVSSLVDPLLAVFIPLGFTLTFLNLLRNRFLVFLIISFIFELLIISVTNPYDAPPLTRMFLFVPFYFVFAMFGLDWLVGLLAGLTTNPVKFFYFSITVVLIAAGILNMIQSNLIYDDRTDRYSLEPVFLRLLQHDAIESPGESKIYLFLTDENYPFYWNYAFQDIYGVPDSKAQLQRLNITNPSQLSDEWLAQMKEQKDTVIIVPYTLEESVIASLQSRLEQTGKISCEVRDLPWQFPRYMMWYSDKYPNLCLEAQSLY